MGHEDIETASRFKLVHAVTDLVLRGKRGRADIEALDRALQLFKEGRLEGAVTKGLPPDTDMEELFAFFDTPVDKAALIDEAVALLRAHGVRLVGEILRFKWQFESKAGENIHQLFLRRRIPVSTDPWSLGWRPAYLRDPEVHAALGLSGALLFTSFNVWDPNPLSHQPDGRGGWIDQTTHFVGQSIALLSMGNGEIGLLQAKALQARLASVPVLHAAMYLPEDYVDGPVAVNPECVEYQARIVRARQFLQDVFPREGHWAQMGVEELRRPVSRDQDAVEAELRRRRDLLVRALKAEGMSPHFFAIVTKNDPSYFRRARSVREYLSKTPIQHGYTYDRGRHAVENIEAWGLKLGMTEAEIDHLFG